jgi:hypothetical protein
MSTNTVKRNSLQSGSCIFVDRFVHEPDENDSRIDCVHGRVCGFKHRSLEEGLFENGGPSRSSMSRAIIRVLFFYTLKVRR